MGPRRDKSTDQDAELEAAWKELSDALSICFRDGWGDPSKPVWEQEYPPVKDAWRRLTLPKNRDALQRKLGSGGTPEGERTIQEAFRQASRNAEPF